MKRLLVVALVVAGCVGSPPADDPEAGAASAAFAVAPPERLSFRMSDGVVLDAVAWRPEGLSRTPVILHAMPYAGVCMWAAPEAPYPKPCAPELADPFWIDEYNGLPRALVEAGYTFLDLSVRGTGASGGCFGYLDAREREDLGEVLDALHDAPWAGDVGMVGLSYMSITPLQAMEARPGRVKAVVLGGVGFDEYTFAFTPQGASTIGMQLFWGSWFSSVQGPQPSPRALGAAAERACPDVVEAAAAVPLSHALDARDREHFLERRFIDGLRDLPIGVLVVQGTLDRGGGQQVELLWPALEGTPRALVLGSWEHRFPDAAMLQGSGVSWPQLPLSWLDHFLRGGPVPDALGRVHVQVEGEGWRTADAWPPIPALEALYLGPELTRTPGVRGLAFRLQPEARACGDEGTWAVAMTAPLATDVALVGNPMAWLELTSTSPSATVGVDLWDVPRDDVCEARLVSRGAADLRFRDDPFEGKDVPLGAPLGARIDLHASAWLVPAGHRIAVTLSTAGEHGATGRPAAGMVSVAPTSHVLLPMTQGLGAPPPDVDYPVRPFGPGWTP